MLTVSPINFNQNYKTNKKQKYSQPSFGINAKLSEEFEQTLIKHNLLGQFKKYLAEMWDDVADTVSFEIQKANLPTESLNAVFKNETNGVQAKGIDLLRNKSEFDGIVYRGLTETRKPGLRNVIKDWNKSLMRQKQNRFIDNTSDQLHDANFHKFISDITQFKTNLVQTRNILPSSEIKLKGFYTEAGENLGVYANDDLLYTLNKNENLDVGIEYLWSKLRNNPRYELGSNKHGKVIRFKPNKKPLNKNETVTTALAIADEKGRYMLETVKNGLPVKRIIKGENDLPIETEKLKDGKMVEKLFHREDGTVGIETKYDKDGEYVAEAIKRNESGRIINKYENLGKSERMTMYSENKPVFSQEIDSKTGVIEDVDYNDKGMRHKAVKYEQINTVQDADIELVGGELVEAKQAGIAVYDTKTNSSSTFENIVKRKIEEIDFENNNPIFKRLYDENGNNVVTVDFKNRLISIFNEQNDTVEEIKFGIGSDDPRKDKELLETRTLLGSSKSTAKPIDSISKRLSPSYKSIINSLSDNNKMIDINEVKLYDKGKIVETHELEGINVYTLTQNNTNGEEISRIRLGLAGNQVFDASSSKFDINGNLLDELLYKLPAYGRGNVPTLSIKNVVTGEETILRGEMAAMDNPDFAALVNEAKAKFELYSETRVI